MAKSKMVKTGMDALIDDLAHQSEHEVLAVWAADCAERVLHGFERVSPDDDRPRQAIEACRAWVRGALPMTEARKAAFASHAAARETETPGAGRAAARAAGHAAATAHVPTHAIAAAVYAATAVRDAAGINDDEAATLAEREWQYHHLLALGEQR